MELEQCWAAYLKAEKLMEQGQWSEAQNLFVEVLRDLPTHIQAAIDDETLKPCQFMCLVTGLSDATVAQSEILNRLGQQALAFNTLNQSYALLQFISLESHDVVDDIRSTLVKHSEYLLAHITAFCNAQRNAHWNLQLEQVQRAHYYFNKQSIMSSTNSIN